MENVFKIEIIHYIETSGDPLEYCSIGDEKVAMRTIDELVNEGFAVRLFDIGRSARKCFPSLEEWNSHKAKDYI